MTSSELERDTPSIQETGISIDRVAKLARLGLLFEETRITESRGTGRLESVFSFIADSPMGRANLACGPDVDILDGIIADAEGLSYDEFSLRFPKFGPYDS